MTAWVSRRTQTRVQTICRSHAKPTTAESACKLSSTAPSQSTRHLSSSQLLFLLPGGRPRLFVFSLTFPIHAGGRPRRFPDRAARRSSTIIASPIWSRSWRRSESIFKTSICGRIAAVSLPRAALNRSEIPHPMQSNTAHSQVRRYL